MGQYVDRLGMRFPMILVAQYGAVAFKARQQVFYACRKGGLDGFGLTRGIAAKCGYRAAHAASITVLSGQVALDDPAINYRLIYGPFQPPPNARIKPTEATAR